MNKVHLQVKDVDEFFSELHLRCKQKTCYSVIETAQKMGVTYEEVKKWAQSNENWTYILNHCRVLCYLHAEESGLIGGLSEKESTRYMQENQG